MNCVLWLESARAEIQVAFGLGVISGCFGGNLSLELIQALFRILFPSIGGMSFSAGYLLRPSLSSYRPARFLSIPHLQVNKGALYPPLTSVVFAGSTSLG